MVKGTPATTEAVDATEKCVAVIAGAAVPLTAIDCVAALRFSVLSVSVTSSLSAPTFCGVNVTGTLHCCPALRLVEPVQAPVSPAATGKSTGKPTPAKTRFSLPMF